jgi:hypothetical protein
MRLRSDVVGLGASSAALALTRMRLLGCGVLAAMAVVACPAEANEAGSPSAPRSSWTYLLLGLGRSPCETHGPPPTFARSSSLQLHAAIGREWLGAGRFGLGGEVGAIAQRDLSYCAAAVVSVNGLYHFSRRPGPAWSPFVTGGASLLAAEGGGAGWNAGLGIIRFTGRRLGFRFEIRAHWFPNENGFAEGTLGLLF